MQRVGPALPGPNELSSCAAHTWRRGRGLEGEPWFPLRSSQSTSAASRSAGVSRRLITLAAPSLTITTSGRGMPL
jgi:hypothetical protein